MAGDGGHITTTPSDIANILRKHWGGVFKRKEVNSAAVQIWMAELFVEDETGVFLTGLPGHGEGSWRIKRRTIKRAVEGARNTMPGPDGIPASAYKILGDVAISGDV